jgi:SGNH hydrolase-like domain, acetyltransferase AlgX
MMTGRRGQDLPPDKLAAAAEITRGLLLSLARAAANHDADLLIVIIPSWNEIQGLGAEDRPDMQRALIREVAAELDNVYVLDLTAEIKALGTRRLYGEVDKHFNAFGAYTAAKSIYAWIERDWPRGPGTAREPPAFDDDPWGMTRPDCELVDGYRDRLLNPGRPIVSGGAPDRPELATPGG